MSVLIKELLRNVLLTDFSDEKLVKLISQFISKNGVNFYVIHGASIAKLIITLLRVGDLSNSFTD
jgi:hypothetical protein